MNAKSGIQNVFNVETVLGSATIPADLIVQQIECHFSYVSGITFTHVPTGTEMFFRFRGTSCCIAKLDLYSFPLKIEFEMY